MSRVPNLLATYWASVIVFAITFAVLPFALLLFEITTGIRLKDPAGMIMAWGFFFTFPIGGIVALIASVMLLINLRGSAAQQSAAGDRPPPADSAGA